MLPTPFRFRTFLSNLAECWIWLVNGSSIFMPIFVYTWNAPLPSPVFAWTKSNQYFPMLGRWHFGDILRVPSPCPPLLYCVLLSVYTLSSETGIQLSQLRTGRYFVPLRLHGLWVSWAREVERETLAISMLRDTRRLLSNLWDLENKINTAWMSLGRSKRHRDNILQAQRGQSKEGLAVLVCLKLNGVYLFKCKLGRVVSLQCTWEAEEATHWIQSTGWLSGRGLAVGQGEFIRPPFLRPMGNIPYHQPPPLLWIWALLQPPQLTSRHRGSVSILASKKESSLL